jgi:hypothetical protein
LIATALLPIAAAYYSSIQFNASMAKLSSQTIGVKKARAVSYE